MFPKKKCVLYAMITKTTS